MNSVPHETPRRARLTRGARLGRVAWPLLIGVLLAAAKVTVWCLGQILDPHAPTGYFVGYEFTTPKGRRVYTERTYGASFGAELKEGSIVPVLHHPWWPRWNRPLAEIEDVEIISPDGSVHA